MNMRDFFCDDGRPLGWAVMLNSEWMREVPDETMLSMLSVPGTRNTCSLAGPSGDRRWDQAQALTLMAQLNIGIRFLDIRCRHIQDRFTIRHGTMDQGLPFDNVQRDCIEFFREKPSECILLSLKNESDGAGNTRSFDATFRSYLSETHDVWYTGSTVPPLGQVRGKIVLISREPNLGGIHWDSGVFNILDDWRVPDLREGVATRWRQIRAHLEAAEAGPSRFWYINFTGAAKPPSIPLYGVPYLINRSLLEHLTRTVPRRAGTLVMDYPGERLIDRIINLNFPSRNIEGRRPVLEDSEILLQNASGKFVTAWASGNDYYYPQYGDSVPAAEPLRLQGDSSPLLSFTDVLIVTTNTSGMRRKDNRLADVSGGPVRTLTSNYVAYTGLAVGSAFLWQFQPAGLMPKVTPIFFDDTVHLRNSTTRKYLAPDPGRTHLWTKQNPDDDTRWIIRRGRIDIADHWAEPVDLGGGWGEYRHVFYGGRGILYALTPAGEVHYFRDRGPSSLPDERWAVGRLLIGGGFAPLKHAFSAGRGILYTVDESGILSYYRDIARDNTTTASFLRWANLGKGLQIGRGWDGFKTVLSGGNGLIYAIQPDGRLLLYIDQAQDDTTPENKRWAASGASSRIGSSWGGFLKVFYGGSGVLYAVTTSGDLLYYQDGLRVHGTDNRWIVENRVAGRGWNRYVSESSHVFGGEDGEIYVVTKEGKLLYFRNNSYPSAP